MSAIKIRFAKDDSDAFVFVGRATIVGKEDVPELRQLIKKEIDFDYEEDQDEYYYLEHPKSDVLEKWLENHGDRFVCIEEDLIHSNCQMYALVPSELSQGTTVDKIVEDLKRDFVTRNNKKGEKDKRNGR